MTTFLTAELKALLLLIVGFELIEGIQRLLPSSLTESHPAALALLAFLNSDIAFTYPHVNRMPWRNIFLRALVYYLIRATWMFDASDWGLRLGVNVVLGDAVCGWVFGCLDVGSARAERKKVHVCEKPIAVECKSGNECEVVPYAAGRVLQKGEVEQTARVKEIHEVGLEGCRGDITG